MKFSINVGVEMQLYKSRQRKRLLCLSLFCVLNNVLYKQIMIKIVVTIILILQMKEFKAQLGSASGSPEF